MVDRTEEWDMTRGPMPEKKGIVDTDGRGDSRTPDRLPQAEPVEPPPNYGNGEFDRKKARVGSKDTNPKDAVGIRKWRVFTTVPFTVVWEIGVALLEGARKYGRHNYRVAGVRGSVYIDAAMGHLTQWWEGEDRDPDTGLSHITKAMASLVVLRDAMIQDKFVDDRPPKTDIESIRAELQDRVNEIFERIPDSLDAYVEGDQHDDT